jgi:ligand-binding sensor domain-containing protein
VNYNASSLWGRIDNDITALAITPGNQVYVGVARLTTVCYDRKNWRPLFGYEDKLSGLVVNCMTFDKNGTCWAGTENGLLSIEGTDVRSYPSSISGVAMNSITSIACDNTGGLWMGIYENVVYKNNDEWTLYSPYGKSPASSINSIAVDKQGNVWEGSGGLAMFDGTRWVDYLPNVNGRSCKVCIDNKERVWAGTSTGLLMFDGTEWHGFSLPFTSAPQFAAAALSPAPDGTMWAISNEGEIVKFDAQNRLLSAGPPNTPGAPNRSAFLVDHSNRIWLGKGWYSAPGIHI